MIQLLKHWTSSNLEDFSNSVNGFLADNEDKVKVVDLKLEQSYFIVSVDVKEGYKVIWKNTGDNKGRYIVTTK